MFASRSGPRRGELLLQFIDLRLKHTSSRGERLCLLQIIDRLSQVALTFFEARQVNRDLLQDQLIGVFISRLLFVPAAQGQSPNVPRARSVPLFFVIEPTKRKQYLVTVRIGA